MGTETCALYGLKIRLCFPSAGPRDASSAAAACSASRGSFAAEL